MSSHALSYAVILAGGKGERFWPLSTSRHPKQFLSLVGGKPLLRAAVDRLQGLLPPEHILVITGADLVEASRALLPELPAANIVGEPFGRDTAPAVALATACVQSRSGREETVYAMLTADQVIGDVPVFQQTLDDMAQVAADGRHLVTIGIVPTGPSTGFGYIETRTPVVTGRETPFHEVLRFVEKPDAATAAHYIRTGRHFWNSGMFVWSCGAIRRAFRKYEPGLETAIDRFMEVAATPSLSERIGSVYTTLEKRSIDYAVMEKADNIRMAACRFAWDDVGSWTALGNHIAPDARGNVCQGRAETPDATGNVVVAGDRPTVVYGVSDLIVVQAEGVTLVCPRDRAQDIKRLVAWLKERGGYESIL